MTRFFFGCLALFALVASSVSQAAAQTAAPAPVPGLDKIGHIIVIYMENRSFDSLYGSFPGADGIANAGTAATQVAKDGKELASLPPVLNTNLNPKKPVVDTRFPLALPNAPFRAEPYAGPEQTTGDLVHRFYHEQLQIDDGKMDKFAAWTDAGGLTMSAYDGSKFPLWNYAKRYVLMDRFFHAAFGGSFLNHFWLICACTPKFENAPAELVAKLNPEGVIDDDDSDNAVTPDFYAVNTLQPKLGPHGASVPQAKLLPPQDMPTIGDRLTEKGVKWAWYSGGWADAVAGKPDPLFQFHHQPFAFFARYANDTDASKEHLKDGLEFVAGIEAGQLPPVTFFKPIGELNEHPGYSTILASERYAADLVKLIEDSPLWKDSLIIVTYDENGGLWDHVAPPKKDRWGPGSRVPTLIISPFAKTGFIDHTEYDTTSILKLIEARYGLAPLGERDAAAADMTNALDLK
jgi:phospholipase C